MRERISLCVLLIYCCIAYIWASQELFIKPDDHAGDCSVNDTVLSPCYSIYELIRDDVLSSLNKSSVSLLLLPGTHIIPDNQVLEISGFHQVFIYPWLDEQKVLIECANQTNLSEHMILSGNTDVNISSIHFNFCILEYRYTYETTKAKWTVSITDSIFENSQTSGTITISNPDSPIVVNVVVLNCKFFTNWAAFYISSYGQLAYIGTYLAIANSLFDNNGELDSAGNALILYRTNLEVSNSKFINNSGGAIQGDFSILNITDTVFHGNHALRDGSAIHLRTSTLSLINCKFSENFAANGAIYISGRLSDSSFIRNSTFLANNAEGKGGAIYIKNTEIRLDDCQFLNNSADQGGAIYAESEVNFQASHSVISSNEARQGGAIYCKDSSFSTADSYSKSNVGSDGGFTYLSNCQLELHNYQVIENIASNGGALYAESESHISIFNTTVAENLARENGGGMYLVNSVELVLDGGIFNKNVADLKGGAIYFSDQNCEMAFYHFSCFLEIRNKSSIFSNNSAPEGQVLYGGLLDRCCMDSVTSCDVLGIDYFKNNCQYDTEAPWAITSDPIKVCICIDSEIDCSIRNLTFIKTRGQTVNFSGVIVDQDGKPKPSILRASYSRYAAELGEGEDRKEISENCSTLSYHVLTQKTHNTSVNLVIQPEGVCEHSEDSTISFLISIKPCGRGFQKGDKRCVCDQRLTKRLGDSITCDVDTESLQVKDSSVWLSYDDTFLKLNLNCPPDYCKNPGENFVNISFAFPDEQCANNRGGVICGGCQENYSIVLGSSKCKDCTSSINFVWLIPLFAVAGIALVALLLILNMTISHGTLNGLIFYANVVSISGLTSYQCVPQVLSIFIAWVNLDLGVETCFYPGMDTYQKAWLQLAFPLYIWLLVGAIILVSHYSTTAVKVFGRNNIAILATLFLLSYAKILKTIITALNYTNIYEGNANDTNSDILVAHKVWKNDGSIKYMSIQHMPLFVVALALLIFLFLPYTLLLTFGQYIRSIQTQKELILQCIKSTAFVSIMDAYHAPYTNKHRYWTGLMLLTRCVLFLGYAFSYSEDELLSNMYITSVVLTAVFNLRICTSKVYKNFGVSLLELSFLFNIALLSSTLYYLQGKGSSDQTLCKCTIASISISLITLVGIFLYHAYLQLKKTKCFPNWNARRGYDCISPGENTGSRNPRNLAHNFPTRTTVEL